MARAATSLPVPDSPRISTLLSNAATWAMTWLTWRISIELPVGRIATPGAAISYAWRAPEFTNAPVRAADSAMELLFLRVSREQTSFWVMEKRGITSHWL